MQKMCCHGDIRLLGRILSQNWVNIRPRGFVLEPTGHWRAYLVRHDDTRAYQALGSVTP